MDKIKVLIADDHPIVREGLFNLINGEPEMTVVGMAKEGGEAIEKALALDPDIILMDLVMPSGKDGFLAIKEIIENKPEARILVLTSFGEDILIRQSIQAGAVGFIMKDSDPDELLDAIRKVFNNQPFMKAETLSRLMKGLKNGQNKNLIRYQLTSREVEVVRVVAMGNSSAEIAKILNISERTVTKHISNILHKLQLENRTQIAIYAAREGWINLDIE